MKKKPSQKDINKPEFIELLDNMIKKYEHEMNYFTTYNITMNNERKVSINSNVNIDKQLFETLFFDSQTLYNNVIKSSIIPSNKFKYTYYDDRLQILSIDGFNRIYFDFKIPEKNN